MYGNFICLFVCFIPRIKPVTSVGAAGPAAKILFYDNNDIKDDNESGDSDCNFDNNNNGNNDDDIITDNENKYCS